ncbi:MAG: TonB C-terminal domain-containing protein [Candidatus Omnitrophota bacterium]
MNERTSIIVSFLIHIGVFCILILPPRSRYQLITDQFIPVSLQPFQDQAQQQPAPQPQKPPEPKPPEPKPPEPEVKKEPEPIKEKPELNNIKELLKDALSKKNTPTPAPTKKKIPTQKPTPKKAGTPTPTPPAFTPIPTEKLIPLSEVPAIVESASAPIVKSASTTEAKMTLETGNSNVDFSNYAAMLQYYLRQNWRAPAVRRPERREYVTVASFTIYKDGLISDIIIEQSSGWTLSDESVIEAIKLTSGLLKLPPEYADGSIRAKFPFILPME